MNVTGDNTDIVIMEFKLALSTGQFEKWRRNSYGHIPKEQVTPVILDKEEQTNDKQEVAEADEDDNNHPWVNWKLKRKSH